MPKNKQYYWLNAGTWILFTAGATAGLCFQLYYHKYIGNDTLSYINVAQLYAAGKLQQAINGYWSPLYSWLIAFFIKTGLRPHITCYCLNIAAAAACFYFAGRLGRRYLSSPVFLLLFRLFTIASLLFYALSELTPDLLATAALLWFLTLLFSDRFTTSSRLWILTGIAGGLAFMAKSYNFLFINLLLAVLFMVQIRTAGIRRERRYRATGLAFLVFWAVSLLWIIPLSLHENKPVFSTAAGYSHGLAHPSRPGHPITNGIIPPPFDGAWSAWYNPQNQLDSCAWPVFGNAPFARYQSGLIVTNAREGYRVLDYWHAKTVLLLVALALLAWYGKDRLKAAFRTMKPWLLVLLLYPLGYLPYFILERYIYLDALLLWLLLFYLLQEAYQLFPAAAKRLALFALLFAGLAAGYVVSGSRAFIRDKITDYHQYRSLYLRLPELQFLENKRIVCGTSNYIIATQLCYRLQARLYGTWNPARQDKAKQYQVQYLLAGSPRQEAYLQLRAQLPLEEGTLYIYKFIY